jgi:hypothetical protein
MEVPNPVVERFASSAAHVTGKPLASSETLTWLRDHFKVSLSMAKPEIDQLFLVGINRIFSARISLFVTTAPPSNVLKNLVA